MNTAKEILLEELKDTKYKIEHTNKQIKARTDDWITYQDKLLTIEIALDKLNIKY